MPVLNKRICKLLLGCEERVGTVLEILQPSDPTWPCHHSSRSDLREDYSLANWGLCKTIPADMALEEGLGRGEGQIAGVCVVSAARKRTRKKPFERKNLD